MVLILRFTYNKLGFPGIDAALITYGTIIGYMIIISAILTNYILGASISYLELIINALGIILFTSVGGVAIAYYDRFAGGGFLVILGTQFYFVK